MHVHTFSHPHHVYGKAQRVDQLEGEQRVKYNKTFFRPTSVNRNYFI